MSTGPFSPPLQLPAGVTVKRLLGAPAATVATPRSAVSTMLDAVRPRPPSSPAGGAAAASTFSFDGGRVCFGHPRTWMLELAVAPGARDVRDCLAGATVSARLAGGAEPAVTAAVIPVGASVPFDTFRLAGLRVADALAKVSP